MSNHRATKSATRLKRRKTMKTLILSTVAAAALALSAGTALASSNSSDNGFAVYLESVNKAPTTDRQYLTTEGQGDYTGTESGHRDSSH